MTTPAPPNATSKAYGRLLQCLFDREVDWLSGTVMAMLCTAEYIPDLNVHRYKSAVTNEVVGAGYTAGGVVVPTRTLAYLDKTISLKCGDIEWAAPTITARHAVFYQDTGAAASSPLLACWTFTEDVAALDGPFVLAPTDGVLLTMAAP